MLIGYRWSPDSLSLALRNHCGRREPVPESCPLIFRNKDGGTGIASLSPAWAMGGRHCQRDSQLCECGGGQRLLERKKDDTEVISPKGDRHFSGCPIPKLFLLIKRLKDVAS